MKKILLAFSCLVLVSCVRDTTKVPPPLARTPDCQSLESSFRKEVQETVATMGENVWIVDLEIFYSPKLGACIGKYMASRREGTSEDVSLFVVKNIGKTDAIYSQIFTGQELKNEYEGQKNYRIQIASLQ